MANKKNRTRSLKTESSNQTLTTQKTVEQDPQQTETLQRDILDDFLFHAANYIYVHGKLFISLLIGLIVILISGYGISWFVEYRENVRNERLFQIEQIIYNEELEEKQRFQKALPLLNEFTKSNTGTKQHHLAVLYRGGLLYRHKKYPEAEADLSALISRLQTDSELFALASIHLANILRDQKKTDQAIDVLKQAKSDKLTDVILMELSEAYMNSNRLDKAKETLEILLKDYPESGYSPKAKQLLNVL